MTTILILEGNTPAMLAQGKSDAVPFVTALTGLDPALTLRIANPYAGNIDAGTLDGVDGVVFTGSGVKWSTAAPEAAPQRAAMERVFAASLPVWGSCNGMQLAAVVLGGGVGASPKGTERGMAQGIALTEAGRSHPMMSGKPETFASPCVHRDEVQVLPEKAVLMASNAHSPVQAMVYETNGADFWGVQYHPECSALDVASWLRPQGVDHAGMVADLEQADTNADAAARLGTTPDGLALPSRARELANWLDHVRSFS